MAPPFRGGGTPATRSQSGTLGVALVFSVVIVATAIVVLMSAGAITGVKDSIAIERAEKTLTQLDSEMARVALGEVASQEVDLGRGGQSYAIDSDAGWIKVKRSGGTNPLGKTPLGKIVYQRAGTTVAYQGGGVWKQTPGGGVTMVSPPEFHFRDGTLTLPTITLANSDGTIDDSATISQSGPPTQVFPSGSKTNPVPKGITVVVKSDYYEAWGAYFEERTGGVVEYQHGQQKVILHLVTPIGDERVRNSLSALSTGGTLTLAGAGEKPSKAPTGCSTGSLKVYSDSYNSSEGSYCGTRDDAPHRGHIKYGGTIDVSSGSGNSEQFGRLIAEHIDCDACDKYEVHGNVRSNACDGTCTNLPDASHSYYSSATIGDTSSLDFAIERKVDLVSDPDNNDNDQTGTISSNELSGSSPYELGPGTYYLERIDLSGGETLDLQTDQSGGGNITLVVDEYVNVCDGTIDVQGSHSVEIWVRGSATIPGSDYHFNLDNDGHVDVPGYDASQFTLVGKKDFKAELGNPNLGSLDSAGCAGNGGIFEGVIYAPVDEPPDVGTGIVAMKQSQVYGGIVTGDTYLGTSSAIHYDEALANERVISPNTRITRITYLHISINEVEIES